MPNRSPRRATRARRALTVAALTAGVLALVPAAGQAATVTFGSNLAVPATLDTAHNLNYSGTDIAVPAGNVHVYHDGADTALWNTTVAGGTAAAQSDGQILSLRLEGCVQPAQGGPAPLTDFHFQSLTPAGGGAVKVGVTSQTFQIPVCGQNGASQGTVTTYQPTNMCVHQGDYVDFNDEGGFNNQYYPSGAPYQVIGSVNGSNMDSFIGDNQTNNGATLAPSATTSHNGFASNANEELMLQATLGSGPDATPLCPGGTQGVAQPSHPQSGSAPSTTTGAGTPAAPLAKAALKINRQTDGVNHSGRVKVALLCVQAKPCTGNVQVLLGGQVFGHTNVNIAGRKTSHVAIKLSARGVKLIRRHHRRLAGTIIVTLSGGLRVQGALVLKL